MNDHNFDGSTDGDSDDCDELIWNEFDWERYLRRQDEFVLRYLGIYEQLPRTPDRLDRVAKLLGWGPDSWVSDATGDNDPVKQPRSTPKETSARPAPEASPDAPELATPANAEDEGDDDGEDGEPYTVHKNPIFIASRAILLSLQRGWEQLAHDSARVPQRLALAHYVALRRTEDQTMQAVAALDFGDFALAIALFKRALRELNALMTTLGPAVAVDESTLITHYRQEAMSRCFDLREIWLRVTRECRRELARPRNDESEGEE
jgi:hypothetical protein